jgi:Domain of unknown function (DUF5134)
MVTQTLAWTRSADRTCARSGRSRLAQPLDDTLARVTAAEQDDRQHERGEQVHQSVEGGPRAVAQDDGSEQRKGDEQREPGDSRACESTATDSHRGARIPPHARYGSRYTGPAMVMNGMSMGPAHPTKTAMGGMSMSAPHGATNILPSWLAVIWTLLFLVVLVLHARHVAETREGRRWWHSGHVLMALGMVFMFAPASLDHFNIPAGFWQLLFANAAGAVVAWIIAQALSGRAVNMLWVVMAVDLAAMVYMWSPAGFVAPITWLLVAYFTAQALLWATNSYRRLDNHTIVAANAVNPDGTLTASSVQPLICERDLRPSMFVMTLGMAYMFAAMQLLS